MNRYSQKLESFSNFDGCFPLHTWIVEVVKKCKHEIVGGFSMGFAFDQGF